MKKYVISTDSNADLPKEYIDEHNIVIIPHYYDIDGVEYGGELNLTPHEFYDKMRKGATPTTMASNPGVIYDTFTKYVNDGYDILHISFSSALSSGYNNICSGAREVMEENPGSVIEVIDSATVSLCQGMMVMKAATLLSEGCSLKENAAWIKEHINNFCVQFTVDDLVYLMRGGRLSKTSAFIGSIISLKPILVVNSEGALIPCGTVRGRKRSLSTLVDNMKESIDKTGLAPETICIVHGDVLEDAMYVKNLIEKIYDCNIIINTISPSIGSHSGPGALGLIYIGESR